MTGRLGFLDFYWWLDEDGKHVWTQHTCDGVVVREMLPWPTWRPKGDGTLVSSFHCRRCETHTHGGGCQIEPDDLVATGVLAVSRAGQDGNEAT